MRLHRHLPSEICDLRSDSLFYYIYLRHHKWRQVPLQHMRLVIGYNEQNAEILYSDSWGPGHELKRMPAADAWAITTGISTVEPL